MSKEDSGTHTIMILLIAQFKKVPEFFLEKFNRDNFKDTTLDLLGINDPKGRNLYSVVYKKFLKKMRLDKDKYSNPRFRIKLPSSEIKANTTSKPSGIVEDRKSPVEKINDELEKDSKEEKETTQLKTQTKEASEFTPIVYDQWSAIAIGAVFEGLLSPLRAVWPEMRGLTDKEKESIGEMFLPGFQRFGNELFQFFIFPLIGTVGILGPKIAKGRKLHKEAQEKKKTKKQDDKLSIEEKDRINKLTCTFCNEMFDSAHIKSHQETCKKRIKTQ